MSISKSPHSQHPKGPRHYAVSAEPDTDTAVFKMKSDFAQFRVTDWKKFGKFLAGLVVFCGIGYGPAKDLGWVKPKHESQITIHGDEDFERNVINRLERLEKTVDRLDVRIDRLHDRAMVATNEPTAGG